MKDLKKYMKLCGYVVYKQTRNLPRYLYYNEYDELMNCALYGAYRACRVKKKFKGKDKRKFVSYMIKSIRGNVLTHVDRLYKKELKTPCMTITDLENDPDVTLVQKWGQLSYKRSDFQHNDNDKLVDLVKQVLKSVRKRDRMILLRYILTNSTMADLGRRYNLSPTRICQIINETITYIRRVLNTKIN